MRKLSNAALLVFVSTVIGCGGGGDSTAIAPAGKVLIARTPAQLRWADADTYCKQLVAPAAASGWRLPTVAELAGYAKAGTEVGGGAVWTSEAASIGHFYISLNSTNGTPAAATDSSFYYVRCAHD